MCLRVMSTWLLCTVLAIVALNLSCVYVRIYVDNMNQHIHVYIHIEYVYIYIYMCVCINEDYV